MSFLSEFDFEIKHINGKENRVVDAFSRKVSYLNSIEVSIYHTYFENKVKLVGEHVEEYQNIKENL